MARDGDKGLIRALFQREPQDIRITGYQVGDVTEDRAVHIVAGAALAGQLCAEQITVDGLLFGSVVGRTVTVGRGGRIWGDVYSVTLTVEDGGYVNGWLHTLTGDSYQRVRAQDGSAGVRAIVGDEQPAAEDVPVELRGAIPSYVIRPDQVALLQHFQSELRSAHLARESLERAFDERVEEVAGEARARVRQLEETLDVTRQELQEAQAAQAHQEAELVQWEERFESQGQELDGVRSLLHQRVTALREAEQSLANRRAQVARLELSNNQLQEQLGTTLEPLKRLQDRVESLESALQASVQRNAEQEEAQLRWQELADASSAKALDLENELGAIRRELEQARRQNEELRSQLAHDHRGPAGLDPAALGQAEADWSPDDVQARSARLEAQVEAGQAEIAALEEQLAWHRLSLETAVASLAERGASTASLQVQLQDAGAQARDYQELADNWKTNVGRLAELLYEAEQGNKRQAAELERLRGQIQADRVERNKLQQAATRQIAELQAELDARDRQLEELASRVEKRRKS